MRIALIHALRHSPPPVEAAFARLWPEATLMNLLDDTLSSDLQRDGALTSQIHERFMTLSRYAERCGADAILFTCSAFGPCIEAVARELHPMPVLKPNEAMIEDASGTGKRVGLVASFAPTLQTLPKEFPASVDLSMTLAEGALAALDGGDTQRHDQLVVEAALRLGDCDVIALTQFSLARAASAVAAATGKTVLTTPDSAVLKLKRLLQS
jgi:Asp/Glu/hydantoin racemase